MAAIINVCADPRLDHNLIRQQVRLRLEHLRLPTDSIFITNEPGGNIGTSFRNTLRMLQDAGMPVVLAAVLHHDDCVAARMQRRVDLATTAQGARNLLDDASIGSPVLTGMLSSNDSYLAWDNEPDTSTEVLRFRMPRMFG